MFRKPDIAKSKKTLIIYVVFVAVILAVYGQVHQFEFVNIDDNIYVTENYHIKSGITLESIRWALTTTYAEFWHPLTWLSLMADYELYGLHAGGYHVTNLILHILSTLLLFWLFHRMTGALWKSAFVAAFFALHPLHVESVAWVSERKDVLSAFFWMLTLCCYVVYTEKQSVKRYLLVVFSFVLALLSKPMVVTLPVIMILLDYWPLKRFESKKENVLLWQIKEKIPFFACSAIIIFFLLYSPHQQEAIFKPFSLLSRLANAPVAFMTYLVKTFWPHNMAVFYPFPSSIPAWKVFIASLLITVVCIFVIVKLKRLPYLFVGWGWFAVAIAPVIGIIQISLTAPYAMADRYHYLPSIGIAVMLAWGVSHLFNGKNKHKNILFPAAVSIFILFSFFTWRQCGFWKNSESLWEHALKVTKNNFMAHGNFGFVLMSQGKTQEALDHFQQALRLKPDHVLLYLNRGGAYAELGFYENAFADFNKAILIKKDFAASYQCRGIIYSKIGQYRKAVEDFNASLRLKPDDANAYHQRAKAYTGLNLYQPAMKDFNRAIALHPDNADFLNSRGNLYFNLNQYQRAAADFDKAVRLNPQSAEAYSNRGAVCARLGEYEPAIKYFKKALTTNPDYLQAYLNIAAVYGRFNQYHHVVESLTEAVRLQPDNPHFYYNRGIAYAKIGQYSYAINDFSKAIHLNENHADAYNIRAVVYFKTGDKASGCRDARKACDLGNCATLGKTIKERSCR